MKYSFWFCGVCTYRSITPVCFFVNLLKNTHGLMQSNKHILHYLSERCKLNN